MTSYMSVTVCIYVTGNLTEKWSLTICERISYIIIHLIHMVQQVLLNKPVTELTCDRTYYKSVNEVTCDKTFWKLVSHWARQMWQDFNYKVRNWAHLWLFITNFILSSHICDRTSHESKTEFVKWQGDIYTDLCYFEKFTDFERFGESTDSFCTVI